MPPARRVAGGDRSDRTGGRLRALELRRERCDPPSGTPLVQSEPARATESGEASVGYRTRCPTAASSRDPSFRVKSAVRTGSAGSRRRLRLLRFHSERGVCRRARTSTRTEEPYPRIERGDRRERGRRCPAELWRALPGGSTNGAVRRTCRRHRTTESRNRGVDTRTRGGGGRTERKLRDGRDESDSGGNGE